MGWVDQVPRAGKLYIGGLHALYRRPDLFKEAGITHIVSLLDFNIYDSGDFQNYKHIHLRLEDDPNVNLLEHFGQTNQFIEDALDNGEGVFVHCAMGKSRSATVVCAHLMHKYRVSPLDALAQVCEGRPVCSPNPGFMEQLEVYSRMLQAKNESESNSIYEKWTKERYTGELWSWDRRKKDPKL